MTSRKQLFFLLKWTSDILVYQFFPIWSLKAVYSWFLILSIKWVFQNTFMKNNEHPWLFIAQSLHHSKKKKCVLKNFNLILKSQLQSTRTSSSYNSTPNIVLVTTITSVQFVSLIYWSKTTYHKQWHNHQKRHSTKYEEFSNAGVYSKIKLSRFRNWDHILLNLLARKK